MGNNAEYVILSWNICCFDVPVWTQKYADIVRKAFRLGADYGYENAS